MQKAKTRDIAANASVPGKRKKRLTLAQKLAIVRSWREGDEQEQKETGSYLMRVLDEDRLSPNRKLFPCVGGCFATND
jgi:hypothetical protein